ncbi:hypothetical protein BGZ79_005148, partial [Entomortierella chlamydospora]
MDESIVGNEEEAGVDLEVMNETDESGKDEAAVDIEKPLTRIKSADLMKTGTVVLTNPQKTGLWLSRP